MAQPTLLKTPIAQDGAKNTIPETTGSTTGLLSQQYGWQEINALPLTAGGIAPSRLDFNGVFNLLSNILFYTQKGWQWEFDETQSYFAGCTVKDTADGKTYVCIADVSASTTHPSSDTTHWKLSDLATKDDLANYLPLAGGELTGNTISRSVNNSYLTINGKGAYLDLFGSAESSNAGEFNLSSYKDGTHYAVLTGKPTGSNVGTLTWCGHNVLTDSNGGYLPLSGGAMTGTTIKRNVTDSLLNIMSGTDWNEGAYLELYGKNKSNTDGFGVTKGCFILSAENGTDEVRLVGQPNIGQLLFRAVYNNTSTGYIDLGGSAIVAKSLGTTGYTKRADGLILQWGQSSNVTRWDFPITFPTAVIGVYAGINYNGEQSGYNAVKTLTTSYLEPSLQSTQVTTYWLVLGY